VRGCSETEYLWRLWGGGSGECPPRSRSWRGGAGARCGGRAAVAAVAAAVAAAGGVCARARRWDQRPAGVAFSMPLAAAGRAKGKRRRGSAEAARLPAYLRCLQSVETADTAAQWTSEETEWGALGCLHVPRADPRTLTDPPPPHPSKN
jgi:hypothetical protein